MSTKSVVVPDRSVERKTLDSSKISVPPLLGASLEQLQTWVKEQGQPVYRGKQLHDWIYHKGARSLSEITVFSKQWRAEVANIPVGRSALHYRSVASDDTVKYLLRLADGQIVETVGIPSFNKGRTENKRTTKSRRSKSSERLTVCVSTQVGCPMACDFCATGKGGYQRNLERHEIVDQVLTVQEDFGERVSHIVFMGMGEPLLNMQNVLGAIESLNQDVGIGQRCLTLSTVGIPRRILELAEYKLQVTLAVSLHAPNQSLREQIIPSARPYKIDDLLAECREYVKITGRRVSFEYILLAGVNDLPEHAVELAKRLRGFQSHVNLIPYNPIQEVDYKRPSRDRIQAFTQILEQKHIAVSVRYSRGLEADAACGQLRTNKTQVLK
ncbi:23S rRNA (adenine(2503)-C(2))-methyltransferase RlmN [Mastigocoleus testarum]|uniref:Probable dual-specificity RNA methyltransferase RlmN n=1 Tax=Mastigocoleus testarum BC008 TaxID=371196 RepID=A0A0V7ZUI2_9CYAN|nr:23S rRNA (adenine(2503)-C(2))-methyltransferase RlmN [Mastigocoleus testarum]KST68249.1 23S rRNA (adenine(2503)-C2)-methyltransferase [Mastigocoleus testarum BC008]KST68259.1 23S rRNA (adenine(2503)-C2)-methyltransferase [Mastigocoleus testarum BC008]